MSYQDGDDRPVVIAGGGPVGLALAMDLARLGVGSIVLEQRHDQPPNPRCNTTNARSMELLRRLGCADEVRRSGLPPDHSTDIVYLDRLNGHELTRYRRSTTGAVLAGQPRRAAGWREPDDLVAANWPTPEPQHYLSQLYLEPVLRRHTSRWGVDLREGWAYEGFADHDPGPDGGITVEARNLADGTSHEIRARYLVGTDGSNSVVRAAIGARLVGVPRLGDTVSTFFRSPDIAPLVARTPGWMLRFLGGVTLIAIDGRDQWLIHTPVPPGQTREGYDPEPAIFRAIGQPIAYEVLGQARWTPRALVSTKFREGRVFLAGDAAHLWIPMGGFGMNAGIADAVSLSWRLAGVLGGTLDERILDTYEAERAPIGGKVAAQAARWGRELHRLTAWNDELAARLATSAEARADLGARIRATNLGEFECPGFQLGYVYTDSPVICHEATDPPASTLEHYEESTWPGARLPHVWRADGASIFDQLGPMFTLIRTPPLSPGASPDPDAGRGPAERPGTASDGSHGGRAVVAEAERRGVSLVVLDVPEPEAAARYGAGTLTLVRPDQHVAWRAGPGTEPGGAEAARVWDVVTGRTVPPRTVRRHQARRLEPARFLFGEGLRVLPDGRLVFSDMIGCRVLAADPATGDLTVLHEVPGQPNGLGLLSDGRLVVASMLDRQLLITADADPASPLQPYADLSAVATGYLGDLTVDAADRVYVDDTGARVLHGEPISACGRLIRVDGPDHHEVLAEGLSFPNGIAADSDGQVLFLGLSGARQVVQMRLWADGSIGEARPYARQTPDGLALEAGPARGLWVCHPGKALVVRYDPAGRPTDEVELPLPGGGEGRAIACAVDAGGTTLWVVGIEALGPGMDLFAAMAAKATVGHLWRADLTA
ncbi:MAG: FAD-dependent monooxygenase [Acidimicrobiales bacterium]